MLQPEAGCCGQAGGRGHAPALTLLLLLYPSSSVCVFCGRRNFSMGTQMATPKLSLPQALA